LVRLAYFDEAGVSSKNQEPYLVVGGILVHGDHQLEKLEQELAAVVDRHIPEKYREGLTLHTSDIYGGNGKVFDKGRNPYWTAERRMAIMADLAKIPAKTNILVCCSAVERAKFPQTMTLAEGEKPDLTIEAHVCAFMACLLEIDFWLRQNAKREHCLVIVENNERAKKLIAETQRYHQDKNIVKTLSEEHREYFPLQKIKEDPLFAKKKPSHPLVLADFVAYVWKRVRMKDPWIAPYYTPWRDRHAALKIQSPGQGRD
jgi:hypothetical protein